MNKNKIGLQQLHRYYRPIHTSFLLADSLSFAKISIHATESLLVRKGIDVALIYAPNVHHKQLATNEFRFYILNFLLSIYVQIVNKAKVILNKIRQDSHSSTFSASSYFKSNLTAAPVRFD